MKEMNRYPISENARVISGFAFKSTEFMDSGIPVIKINNVKKETITLDDCQFVDKKYLSLKEKYKINNGDVLIALTGSHLSQPNSVVGRVAQYSYKEMALLNQRVGKFIIKDRNKLDLIFLYYYLIQGNVLYGLALNAKGSANQANISPSDVERIRIPEFKLGNQKNIASILSVYDDCINNNRRRIQLLEEAARLLYREWFVYFRFPGHEKVKLVDHEGIAIPEGWNYLPITKIKIFKKTSVGVPVFVDTRQYYQTSEIDGTNITGSGEEVDYENRPSRAGVTPRINTVYFAKMKDTNKVVYFNKGNAELLEKILLSTGMAGFSTNEKYLAFLFGLLTSYEFVQNKNNYATGATQVSLSDGGLKKIKIILPKLELIEKYSSIINSSLEACSYLRNQNQKLAQARDLLLPRLMSGNIEV